MANELKHCVIAHHGELEYGSPKKPALAEAMALHFADCTDAKMQTLTEIFKDKNSKDWLGYNRPVRDKPAENIDINVNKLLTGT